MSNADDNQKVDISAEGNKACGRIGANLKALDKAIEARIEKLGSPSASAQQKAMLATAKANNPESSAFKPNNAQQNSKDHADKLLENILQTAIEKKLPNQSIHDRIEQEFDTKYPLDEKVKLAKDLGITEVQIGTNKIGLEIFAKETGDDIKLAKATASLLAEGHPILEFPKSKTPETSLQSKTRISKLIIKNAEQARLGIMPEHKPESEAKKLEVIRQNPHTLTRRGANVTTRANNGLNITMPVAMAAAPLTNNENTLFGNSESFESTENAADENVTTDNGLPTRRRGFSASGLNLRGLPLPPAPPMPGQSGYTI